MTQTVLITGAGIGIGLGLGRNRIERALHLRGRERTDIDRHQAHAEVAHEIDDRVAPVARCRFGRLGGFEQQEAVAAGGGLQCHLAVAHHRRGAG